MRFALLVAALSAPPVLAQPKEPDRVGRIIVEGNADTPDRAILPALDLRPGQILNREKVAVAEKRLNKLGLFRSATVEIISNELDSTFKDIRIVVVERSWVWLTFASEELVVGAFTLDGMLLQDTTARIRAKVGGRAR